MSGICRCRGCKTFIPAGDIVCKNCDISNLPTKLNNVEILKVDSKNTGIKHDQNKPDLSIIPKAALDLMASAFMYGANKYGRDNFRGGMEWSRLTSAAMRHITAWQERENIDVESGNNHIGHALACLAMLAYYIENNKGTDNRPKNENN